MQSFPVEPVQIIHQKNKKWHYLAFKGPAAADKSHLSLAWEVTVLNCIKLLCLFFSSPWENISILDKRARLLSRSLEVIILFTAPEFGDRNKQG